LQQYVMCNSISVICWATDSPTDYNWSFHDLDTISMTIFYWYIGLQYIYFLLFVTLYVKHLSRILTKNSKYLIISFNYWIYDFCCDEKLLLIINHSLDGIKCENFFAIHFNSSCLNWKIIERSSFSTHLFAIIETFALVLIKNV